ncbi:hypothetical protein VCJ_002043 [Vibrio metoecus]|nr:hypothetical protein VCJ_002043 [Vibrio metoecus]
MALIDNTDRNITYISIDGKPKQQQLDEGDHHNHAEGNSIS